MEQPTQKKEWTKPELIVLVRSKPEEAVLAACKNASAGSNAANSDTRCRKNFGNICTTCALTNAS